MKPYRKHCNCFGKLDGGTPTLKDSAMSINLSLAPIVALLAGILILVMPRLLNYIVAIYLILTGLLGLLGGGGSFHIR